MRSPYLFALLSTLAGPLTYVVYTYAEGWFHIHSLAGLLPFLGGGAISIGAWLLFVKRSGCQLFWLDQALFLLTICVAHYVLVFALLPSPLKIWTRGFLDGIDSRIGLDKIQVWAEDAINRYERGELRTDGIDDWVSGRPYKIAAAEIPDWLRHGWYGRPEFGIRESGHWIRQTHVQIAWHDYQLHFGKPDLFFQGTPSTLVLEINPRPGVIFTYWDSR